MTGVPARPGRIPVRPGRVPAVPGRDRPAACRCCTDAT